MGFVIPPIDDQSPTVKHVPRSLARFLPLCVQYYELQNDFQCYILHTPPTLHIHYIIAVIQALHFCTLTDY